MAWTFPYVRACFLENPYTFMDGVPAFSFIITAKWTSLANVSYAAPVGYYNGTSTGTWCLRKSTTGASAYARFRVCNVATSNVIYVDDTVTGYLVAGTTYRYGCSWAKNSGNGLRLYTNGSLVNSAATTGTGHTVDFTSAGSITKLTFAEINYASNYMDGSLERFIWWPVELTADQFAALAKGYDPRKVVPTPPGVWYEFYGGNLGRIPDLSPNGRHIEDGGTPDRIDADITDGGRIGPSRITHCLLGGYHAAPTGTPGPNPWTYWGRSTHPTATKDVTGLTDGTPYEFCVEAGNTSGIKSDKSATAEATPYVVAAKHTPRKVFGGR